MRCTDAWLVRARLCVSVRLSFVDRRLIRPPGRRTPFHWQTLWTCASRDNATAAKHTHACTLHLASQRQFIGFALCTCTTYSQWATGVCCISFRTTGPSFLTSFSTPPLHHLHQRSNWSTRAPERLSLLMLRRSEPLFTPPCKARRRATHQKPKTPPINYFCTLPSKEGNTLQLEYNVSRCSRNM